MALEVVISIKTALAAIWHGPFKIGPLRQPVSTGDAILRILEVGWKAIASAIVAATAFVMALGVSEAYLRAERQRTSPEALAVNVKAFAKFDPGACQDKALPISVRIENRASKPLLFYAWRIEAYQPGHSFSLDTLTGFKPSSHSDFIIQPAGNASFCVPAPALKADAPPVATLRLEVQVLADQVVFDAK